MSMTGVEAAVPDTDGRVVLRVHCTAGTFPLSDSPHPEGPSQDLKVTSFRDVRRTT